MVVEDLVNKALQENLEKMMSENSRIWKEIYEEFYDMPLEYTTLL